jgi:DNA-binding CsgD family transcriptional regulator
MRDANGPKLGDMSSLAKLVGKLPVDGADRAERSRQLVAELCKVIGAQVSGGARAEAIGLSPRMRQTLEGLVAGDSEKQIAGKLGISQHTIHVYVKQLYKRFDANSRGELLARFIRGGRAARNGRGRASDGT